MTTAATLRKYVFLFGEVDAATEIAGDWEATPNSAVGVQDADPESLQPSSQVAVGAVEHHQLLDRVLGGLGLKPYFGVVLAGDTLTTRKPS